MRPLQPVVPHPVFTTTILPICAKPPNGVDPWTSISHGDRGIDVVAGVARRVG